MEKQHQAARKSRSREGANARQTVTVMDAPGEGESALILDSRAIVASFGGQWALIKEIAEMTLTDSPQRLAGIEKAIAKGEAKTLQHRAHQLRGGVSMFHAVSLTEILQRLEDSGRAGDLSHAREELPGLRTEIHRFSNALRSWINA